MKYDYSIEARFPVSITPGALYVVATPIGNLEDLSPRALEVLGNVDLIIAEDTRHSARLLHHYGVHTPVQAYHDHNELKQVSGLIGRLHKNESIALISDAGTPLISDPGYHLVVAAHAEGIKVISIPGPSALISALSVSGLATDRFVFEGYLPAKQAARRNRLQDLATEQRTLVLFEAPHRIVKCIEDAIDCLGPDRIATLVKEITKQYETVRMDTLINLLNWLKADDKHQKGEFVLVIAGADMAEFNYVEAARILKILLHSLSVKEAAALAAEILRDNRNRMYKLALTLKGE